MRDAGLSLAQALALATANPGCVLGGTRGTLAVGQTGRSDRIPAGP